MQKVSGYAWAVVALLWPVVVLNYLDRQMLSTMRLSIMKDVVELQSAENFGWLMAAFLWIYAISSPMGGAIGDRLSRKWLIIASLGVWSTVTLLMGLAGTYHQLLALRAVMGLSEAIYMPAGLALIADYHRGPTRSLAVGAHLSGVYMGQALGGIGGWVAQEVSWRAAFAGCGAIADRLSRKWLIVASLGVWSSVTLLMGKAATFQQLYTMAAVMGISEALYMPAGLALIADYHPGQTRSLAVGAHLSGV